jgi:hypothetical protein
MAKSFARCQPDMGPDIPARGRIIRPPPRVLGKSAKDFRRRQPDTGPDNPPPLEDFRISAKDFARRHPETGMDILARGPDNPAGRIIRPYFGRIIRPSKSATAIFWEGL